ncbi:extracellular solute-binding protein [Salinarimonas ramus]|uniref:Sugar ABC transporter substrate-binding protein n=1 Tax=Salinarimonas ramus TaxID=690164 RepID=A0A917V2W9_9HYPH|nr:extracellular solute-binding protein [Salinarimonas ramus]GGK25395.1 sugar ABC transporter substrate-binding protein [Salinarimonas ramus]
MKTLPLTRRSLLAGLAAGVAAPAILRAEAVRASDARIVISSNFGPETAFQAVVDAFNAKELGVEAVNQFDGNYEEATAKTLAAISAGRPPALMTTGWKFGYYAKRTLGARDLREIDADAAEALIANFVPSVHPLVTVDDALVGVPWAMSTPITFINMEHWRAAGLEETIPETIDTDWLYERARALDAALGGGAHPTFRSALSLSNNEWTSQSYVQNAGGAVIDETGTVGLDRPESIAGMELFCAPAHEGLWIPVGSREQDAAFVSGALSIVTTSSTRVIAYPQSAPFEVATTRFPGVPGRERRMNSGGNFLGVYAQDAEQAQAAMRFLEFCASREGQELWSGVGYLNSSIHEIPPVTPLIAAAQAQLADGLTAETIWPGTRGFEAQNAWRNWVSRMLERVDPIPEAMARAQDEITALVSA